MGLLLAGVLSAVFVGYEAAESGQSVGEWFSGLLGLRDEDPFWRTNEVAMTAALLVSGAVGVLGRRSVRGATLVLSWIMVFAGLRELVGVLVGGTYREQLTDDAAGQWYAASVAVGALVGVGALVESAGAVRRDRTLLRSAPTQVGLLHVIGVFLLLDGLVALGWRIDTVVDLVRMALERDGALRAIVDASVQQAVPMPYQYWVLPAAQVVVGSLALGGRGASRTGAMVLAGVGLVVAVRQVVMFFTHDAFGSLDDGRSLLWVLITLFALVTALVVLGCGFAARGRRYRVGGGWTSVTAWQ